MKRSVVWKQSSTLVLLLLAILLLIGSASRSAKAADTRDVIVDVYATANIPAKLGTYHIDLVRFDGSTVGYGFDMSINNLHPPGEWRCMEVRFYGVPTKQAYVIRVRHDGHSTEQGNQFWLSPYVWWADRESYYYWW